MLSTVGLQIEVLFGEFLEMLGDGVYVEDES